MDLQNNERDTMNIIINLITVAYGIAAVLAVVTLVDAFANGATIVLPEIFSGFYCPRHSVKGN